MVPQNTTHVFIQPSPLFLFKIERMIEMVNPQAMRMTTIIITITSMIVSIIAQPPPASGPFAIAVEEEASEQRELANKESASAHGKKRDKERRERRKRKKGESEAHAHMVVVKPPETRPWDAAAAGMLCDQLDVDHLHVHHVVDRHQGEHDHQGQIAGHVDARILRGAAQNIKPINSQPRLSNAWARW